MSLKVKIISFLLYFALGAGPMLLLLTKPYPLHKGFVFLFPLLAFSCKALYFDLVGVDSLLIVLLGACLVFVTYFALNFQYMGNGWSPSICAGTKTSYFRVYYLILGILVWLTL